MLVGIMVLSRRREIRSATIKCPGIVNRIERMDAIPNGELRVHGVRVGCSDFTMFLTPPRALRISIRVHRALADALSQSPAHNKPHNHS